MGAFAELMEEVPDAKPPTKEKGAFAALVKETDPAPQVETGAFETPEGMTREEAFKERLQASRQETAEAEEMKPVILGRGQMDVYQGAKQLALNIFAGKETAETYNQELSQEIALYNKNNPDFQILRLLGSIATPLSLIPGMGAATLPGKVAVGSATGGAFSAVMPVEGGDFFKEKAKQVAIGGTIGAALPVAGSLMGKITHFLDELTKPLFKKGRQRDVEKFMREYLSENKPLITKAINKAIQDGDDKTVSQIIADAAATQGDDFGGMIIRLEKDLSRESDSLKSLYARQASGRKAFIDGIAGTEDDLAAAMNKRAANGSRNYGEAFSLNVKADSDLAKLLDNKFAAAARKEAMDIAKAKGTTSHTEILHNIKLGLDKQLNKTGDDALSRAEKSAVDNVKKKLVGWLEKNNPQYDLARKQYALDSAPINKMQVGQEIKNTLINSLENESPSTFASGMRNSHKVLKRATGQKRFTKLDDVLDGDEVDGLKKIAKELSVEAKAKKMAGASKSVAGEITGEVAVSLPHILSRPIVITNHLLKMLGKDKTPEYKKLLVDMMKNPNRFIKAYGASADSPRTKAALDIVRRLNTIAGSQAAAKASTGE